MTRPAARRKIAADASQRGIRRGDIGLWRSGWLASAVVCFSLDAPMGEVTSEAQAMRSCGLRSSDASGAISAKLPMTTPSLVMLPDGLPAAASALDSDRSFGPGPVGRPPSVGRLAVSTVTAGSGRFPVMVSLGRWTWSAETCAESRSRVGKTAPHLEHVHLMSRPPIKYDQQSRRRFYPADRCTLCHSRQLPCSTHTYPAQSPR